MNINDFISRLDSVRFGFLIAKIDTLQYQIDDILNFLKDNSVKLVLTKIPSENIDLINLYEENGFRLKDIQLVYRFDLINFNKSQIVYDEKINFRNARIEDFDQLEKITKTAFYKYGHYFADKDLDLNKSNDVYVDWVKRSLFENNVVDNFIVAEIENEIAGFLTFKIFTENNCKYAAGGIGAVSKKFQNNRVFRQISAKGLEWASFLDLNWVEHNVLATNYPVNKSFSNQGFKISKSFITMHNWLK